MVQTVQLDENKHAIVMLRDLKRSQHEREHCDFIITVQGREFHAHKIVLSLRSPYFKAMLKHDTKEVQEGKVEMRDVDLECVKTCIDYMYTAKFDIPDGKIGDLLHVAIMMQLDDVTEAVSSILRKSLNAENFYVTRDIAYLYDLRMISEECRKFYEVNVMKLSHQSGFRNEKKSYIKKILKNKKCGQEQKLALSLRWVGENEERKNDFVELIKLINLNEVSSEYLSDLLKSHPVISNDFVLYKLLNATLMEKVMKPTAKRGGPKHIILFDVKTNCLKSYYPATDKVQMFHDETFKHLGSFSAVAMNPYIYVIYRGESLQRLNFRDKSSKWERMQGLVADHGFCPPLVSLLGSLFVIGGSNDTLTTVVEKFEPDVNTWLKLKDKPDEISDTVLVSLDDSIYCIGGVKGRGYINSFSKYTPHKSEWVNLEPLKIARAHCAAVAVDQSIFVMGGGTAKKKVYEQLKEVESYDVVSGQWTFLAPMIEEHAYFNAHHLDGCIFIVDGKSIEKYDIANKNWNRENIGTHEPFHARWSISILSS